MHILSLTLTYEFERTQPPTASPTARPTQAPTMQPTQVGSASLNRVQQEGTPGLCAHITPAQQRPPLDADDPPHDDADYLSHQPPHNDADFLAHAAASAGPGAAAADRRVPAEGAQGAGAAPQYYGARRLTEDEVIFDDGETTEGTVHRQLVSAADNTDTSFAGKAAHARVVCGDEGGERCMHTSPPPRCQPTIQLLGLIGICLPTIIPCPTACKDFLAPATFFLCTCWGHSL